MGSGIDMCQFQRVYFFIVETQSAHFKASFFLSFLELTTFYIHINGNPYFFLN